MNKNDKDDFAIKICERLRDVDKNRAQYVMGGPRAIVPLLHDSLDCIERLMLETVVLDDKLQKAEAELETSSARRVEVLEALGRALTRAEKAEAALRKIEESQDVQAFEEVQNIGRELLATMKERDNLKALLREWWNSSRLSCGDGSYLAWYDSFQSRVTLALADEPLTDTRGVALQKLAALPAFDTTVLAAPLADEPQDEKEKP